MTKKSQTILYRLRGLSPAYGWLALAGAFLINTLAYSGSKLIAGSWRHYMMETALDRTIPFLPWTVSVYYGCFIFWSVNYLLVSRQGWERVCRFFGADALAKGVCFVLFLALPTTNTRPVIEGTTIWEWLMRFLYWADSPENLFPSIHCLASWLCWVGIRDRREVPFWYRAFSLFMALAVCACTLTTKQHVLADAVGGVILAELCWLLAGRTKLSVLYGRALRKISGRLCKAPPEAGYEK